MENNILDRVLDVINSSSGTYTDAEWLLLEYCTLRQKIDDVVNQSSDFEMAVESHQNHLFFLEMKYSMLFWDFNLNSLDTLLNERESRIRVKEFFLSKTKISPVDEVILDNTILKIEYYNQLIQLKGRTDYLRKIDYYANNQDEMLRVLGW